MGFDRRDGGEQGHEVVLAVAAHPDDLDFSVSATVALWAREGAEVYYVVCTDGERGFQEELPIRERIHIRREEQRAAAQTVGAKDVIFLGHTDGELANTPKLQEDLVKVMRRYRPTRVMAADPASQAFDSFYRFHPDHRAAALALYDALYPAAGNPHFFPHLIELGYLPHTPREVYFFGSEKPNVWIDISDTIGLKVRALLCHESQIGPERAGEITKYARERAEQVGNERNLAYADAYRRLEIPQ